MSDLSADPPVTAPVPADPVVSPADTPEAAIRAALGVIARETAYSHEAVNRYALVEAVSDAAVALDALLAVGERDRQHIAQLTPTELELQVLENLNSAVENRSEYWPGYQVAVAYIERIRAVLADKEDAGNG